MATMKDIANLLSVELYEEFKIKSLNGKYRITEETLEVNYCEDWKESAILLQNLFNGTYELVPWKPQYNDRYYYVDIDGDIDGYTNSIYSYIWDNDAIDVTLYEMGNCFKTEEEAEKYIVLVNLLRDLKIEKKSAGKRDDI